MTRLVICCDGTWNTPDMTEGGVPSPTNVVRLFNAVAEVDGNGVRQDRYYHPGVGTDPGLLSRILGGAFGQGLDGNIMSAYRALCDRYRSGDDIFLFGFSRGAYTVRSLAGFVWRCGLIDPDGLPEAEIWRRIGIAFDRGYRRRQDNWRDGLGWAFRPAPEQKAIPIRFIGVWDTVGALGVPDELALATLFDNPLDHAFHDTGLGAHIVTARHALAMDETRRAFQPTLWTNVADRDVKQIWFPGNHGDVGGGHRETGLSDGPLAWMIEEAKQAKLAFDPHLTGQVRPSPTGVLHHNEGGVYRFLATMPRAVPEIPGPDLDASVAARRNTPPIAQAPYRPLRALAPGGALTIEIFANQPWNETGLYLTAGQSYTFAATGEWLDASIRCSPDGPTGSPLQPGRIIQAVFGLGDRLEPLLRKLTGNPNAQFRFSRRHGNQPWFHLMGAVANGGIAGQTTLEHESFAIGSGPVTFLPRHSGYFYAYANDAWGFYDNNRGKVVLTVSSP
ncbi:MAG: hypothetical protein RLZZ501_605 [Pseudomonadota bacterium]|jgi:hypothetical protein